MIELQSADFPSQPKPRARPQGVISKCALTLIIVLMAMLCGTSALATPDVNLDNAVDVVDVQNAVNVILALSTPQWTGQGDVNGDTAVDVVDVQTVVNEILAVSTPTLVLPSPGPVMSIPVGLPITRRVFAIGGNQAQRNFTLAPGAPAWLSVSSQGLLQGTPPTTGQFAFLLWVADGAASVSRALVWTVGNQVPVVENEIVYAIAGTTYSSHVQGVLRNDSDPDGHSLTASLVFQPPIGEFVLLTTGFFNFVIPANATGTHGMVYEASDGFGGVTRGSVKFIIIPPNDTEVRADQLVIPGMVQADGTTRVTMVYRLPAGQSVTAATAQVENTASIAALNPRLTGTLVPSGTTWSAELSLVGIAPGIHTVVITASVSGGPEIVRRHRIVVYSGQALRVGSGAYATFAAAETASVAGQSILIDPGTYNSMTGFTTFGVKPGGAIGCTHGPHAIRYTAASTTSISSALGETRIMYGVSIRQGTAVGVNATGTDASVTVVNCEFLGVPLDTTSGRNTAGYVNSSATLHFLDCEFNGWWTSFDSSGTLSRGAALCVRSFGTATMDNCRVINCVNYRGRTASVGGAVSVAGSTGTLNAQLTVTNCYFEGNRLEGNESVNGGAIGVTSGYALIEDSVFVGNQCLIPSSFVHGVGLNQDSRAAGGAIAAREHGAIDVYRCDFRQNRAYATHATNPNLLKAGGGAVACIQFSSVVMDQCTFSNNMVYTNGPAVTQSFGTVALVQRAAALRIENSEMIDNGIGNLTSTPAPTIAVDGLDEQSSPDPSTTVATRLFLVNVLVARSRAGATAHFIHASKRTTTSAQPIPIVSAQFCTFASPQPLPAVGSLSGAVCVSTFGTLTLRDSVIWAPTIPAVNWTGGGATVLNSVIGPVASVGPATSPTNLTSDPLLSPSWLLLSGSPAINAGSMAAQFAGLGMRSALDSLAADSGQVDLGYHAPMPNAGVLPFTPFDAYTQGHQLALHAAFSIPPP